MKPYQKPLYPKQLTAEDVSRSSLDPEDVGRWTVIVTGCHHLCDTEEDALTVYRFLMQDSPVC